VDEHGLVRITPVNAGITALIAVEGGAIPVEAITAETREPNEALPMRKSLLVTLLCLLVTAPAFAQPNGGPFTVRILGYVGDPPAGVKPSYTWTMGYNDKIYKLQVVKHESLSATVSTMDINESVLPYQPNFQLAGADEAIAAFTGAKPGVSLEVLAEMRIGGSARMFNLNSVTPKAIPPK
jgi:hypothetical protein